VNGARAAIVRATTELLALAAAVHPDWDERFTSGAVQQAAQGGMTWPQVLVALARLMADPSAQPRDLAASPALPRDRRCPDPSVAAEGAANARELLAMVRRAGDAA
jgi:hypothetical protein